jgi:hypothetical protein
MSTTTGTTQRRRRLALATSIVALVAFGAAGCGGGDDEASTTTTSTTTTTVASQQGGGGSGGGGQSSGGQSGGGATGPTPTINSFTTPENIDCHNGNNQTFSASWSTANAVRVSISGGGSNLPPSGDTSLPFNCSSAHTFTLTAYGSGGKTATKSITLQPRNVQPPEDNTTDDT